MRDSGTLNLLDTRMPETHSELSDAAAQGAAEAVQEVAAEQQQEAAVAAVGTVAVEALQEAEQAQETAVAAGETAVDAGTTAEVTAEATQAVGEVAAETAEVVTEHDQQLHGLHEAMQGMTSKLDQLLDRIPEREVQPEVTEVTVGNAERPTRNNAETAKTGPGTEREAGTGTVTRTRRHKFGR